MPTAFVINHTFIFIKYVQLKKKLFVKFSNNMNK